MAIKEVPAKVKTYIKRLTWRDVRNFVIDQWFLECLGIAILIAYLVPHLGKSGGWIAAQYSIIYVCPALIFFISGLTMDTKVLIRTAALYRIHLVAQIMSYLYTSMFFFVFSYAALMANDKHINVAVLSGFILLGCTPTTIGSNVVFTRSAHGNHAATLIEVTIANLLSPVLSPALIGMYMSSSDKWGEFRPSSGGGYQVLYRSVFKQLGLTVFVPLFVGQVLRNIATKQVKWIADKFKINKFSSVFLILIMWSTFSSCFATGAFAALSPQSTGLVLMMDFGLYWFFLFSTLVVTRGSRKLHFKNKYLDSVLNFFRFDKRDTIAICYVVPAKTPALGVPLINALYANHSGISDQMKQMLQIPIILYQIEQLCFSSSSVPVFRRWVRDEEEAAKLEAEEKARTEQLRESSNSSSITEVARSEADDQITDELVGPEESHPKDVRVGDVEKQ
ncbi:SBF-like CPA transporter family-domain-containing protein [Lipomyces tetrasporus]|uniref:SBF-like CPA transporter family-domain-containing protein n=1 Tax=Lipomyces tetrasporus TaxID=54092 RepID=A0AAD7QXY6_9ASCO|nr:SBF-like CPA transporter family-domain-containing protein [Lipomyces tetrasporus]KAJ8103490.1 SBF-like CPA transporter family-domain-containing protein [Lipomyces tetrasporus]